MSYAAVLVGALGLAAWVFLRAQGVETWEATRAQRWTIASVILALVLVPVILADTNYDNPAPAQNNAPDIAHVFSRGGSNIALVDPGGPPPARCCDTLLNRNAWPTLPTGRATVQDLLVLLPVDASTPLTDLNIQITGENGLEATADVSALKQLIQHLETRTYPSDTGPAAADGHRVQTGWLARLPVSLVPTNLGT